jgi:transposase
MSKHKSEDYKITAVKYYLENNTNYTKTCNIFKCSERSLKRLIERYEELEEIKRLNKKPISYKIRKEQVKYAIKKLKENEQMKSFLYYLVIKLFFNMIKNHFFIKKLIFLILYFFIIKI